ncbi:MAG TPA: helix-turn-helix domain-containing protein, partial [Nocardioides sp.]
MSKGRETKESILDAAVQVASRLGFTGLTIGQLAEETGMSKSGLFAHFKSKEQLQLQTLEHARGLFTDAVIRPALA